MKQTDNIIGRTYGGLTILKELDSLAISGRRAKGVLCRCNCGKELLKHKYKVVSGHVKSCGCRKLSPNIRYADLVGRRFYQLLVVENMGLRPHGTKGKRLRCYCCLCGCGKELLVNANSLLTANTRSCGCIRSKIMRKKLFNDLSGCRFGRLIVIEMSHRIPKNIIWRCQCDCGNKNAVRGCNLTGGVTQSCGCLFKEKVTRHGMCKKGKSVAVYTRYKRRSPVVRLANGVSNSIRDILRGRKKGKIFDYLPYTPKGLKEHFENLWEPWMNWDNYGGLMNDSRCTWHIDHIIPQSHFDYKSLTDSSFLECWSLSNLRPLEKIENLKKGNKLS